jgi:methionyl-tRNA synthetase
MNIGVNALYMLCVLLEPFMPSFSAKIYAQLNIKRAIEHENILEQFKSNNAILSNLVKSGHVIGDPAPIIKRIEEADITAWRTRFSGKGGQK